MPSQQSMDREFKGLGSRVPVGHQQPGAAAVLSTKTAFINGPEQAVHNNSVYHRAGASGAQQGLALWGCGNLGKQPRRRTHARPPLHTAPPCSLGQMLLKACLVSLWLPFLQCQLIRMGVIDGDAMKALVRKHQPDCKASERAGVRG